MQRERDSSARAAAVASQVTAVGIDVGGTKALAVLVVGGRVESEWQAPSPLVGPELIGQVVDAVRSLGAPAGTAVGVGVPALVDAGGRIRFSPHLPALAGTELCRDLAVALPGARLWTGNDATAACWAEHRQGAATGYGEVLMVTLGTGIGGGIVSGGRLAEGVNRFAGEIGHTVVDPSGPPCPCGRHGCWELYASGNALGTLGREAAVAGRAPRLTVLAGGDPHAVRGEHVSAAAAAGDPPAVEVVERFAWWLALGFSNLVAIFDPAIIVVGGGVIDAGPVVLDPVRRILGSMVEGGAARPPVAVAAAAHGVRAGAIGAALLAAAAE